MSDGLKPPTSSATKFGKFGLPDPVTAAPAVEPVMVEAAAPEPVDQTGETPAATVAPATVAPGPSKPTARRAPVSRGRQAGSLSAVTPASAVRGAPVLFDVTEHFDYRPTHDEPRERFSCNQISTSLKGNIAFTSAMWKAQNMGALGASGYTDSGFIEGLIRLGLKHLADDPEFVDLLPRDRRIKRS